MAEFITANTLSDTEISIGMFIDRPFVILSIGIVVVLMLVFLAGKAGFSLWLMNKLHFSEHLVNEQGFPDFWEINSELNVYQRPTNDDNVPNAVKASNEYFDNKRASVANSKLLAAIL